MLDQPETSLLEFYGSNLSGQVQFFASTFEIDFWKLHRTINVQWNRQFCLSVAFWPFYISRKPHKLRVLSTERRFDPD